MNAADGSMNDRPVRSLVLADPVEDIGATKGEYEMISRTIMRSLAAGAAAGALLIAAQSVACAQNTGVVQGVVTDAAGQPVTGAVVKLKNDVRRLTFMVVTQGQGRFEAKDLPPGTYRVQ